MVFATTEMSVRFNGNLAISTNIAKVQVVAVTMPSLDKFLTVILSAIPYMVFLFVYSINNQAHILPKYSDINFVQPYNISAMEYALFQFQPHQLVSSYHNTFFDLLSAVPYLMHFVIPLVYPSYLYFQGQSRYISKFFWLLGWTMWACFSIWFVLPVAPPWAYANIENNTNLNTTLPPLHLQHKEGCAFARLDEITGLRFFFNMFASNPVPFASFPSGHVCWAVCMFLTLPPGGRLFGVYVGWVAWATLYSCHHYLSDVMAAILLTTGVNKVVFSKWHGFENQRGHLCGFQGVVCPHNVV